MPAHLRRPDGANMVTLPAVDKIADSVTLAARYGHAVVHGPFGTGKYTATKMALDKLHTSAVELDLEPGMSSKAVVRRLHTALIGHDDVSERDLQDDVIEALDADAPGRHLLSRPGRRPQHRSSTPRRSTPGRRRRADDRSHPLADRDLLDAVQSLHPLLLGAGADLLTALDKQVCRGLIRNWVTFLTVALHQRDKIIATGAQPPVLGRELAVVTLQAMPTTMKNMSSA